jgi:uncharacterized protein with HEPN domain
MLRSDSRVYGWHRIDFGQRFLLSMTPCAATWIIGEAARRLDDAFRAAQPGIPWRAMTDVRNILIHTYDGVSAGILVDIVRRDIPPLLSSVKRLLDDHAS